MRSNPVTLSFDEDIELRFETTADRKFSERLFVEAHRAPLQLAGWDETQCQAYLHPQFEMRERDISMRYPEADYFIIRQLGIDIGRIVINHADNNFHLLELVLMKQWRRQGIGSACLRQLCDQADQNGYSISLQVAFDNPAVKLYLGFGFEITEQSDFYLKMQRPGEHSK